MTHLNAQLLKDALRDLAKAPAPADPVELFCQIFDDSGLGDVIESGEATSRLGPDVVALVERLRADWHEAERSQTQYTDSELMQSIRHTAARIAQRLDSQSPT